MPSQCACAFALCATVASLALSQTPSQDSAERDRRWLVDLEYLRTELPLRHINAFHDLDPREFQREVDSVRSEVHALSDDDLVARIMRIVADIHDGHTSLDVTARFNSIPAALAWFPEGIAIAQAGPDYEWLVGSLVKRIDGVRADSAYLLAASLVSREPGANEKIRLSSPFLLQFPALLHGLGLGDGKTLVIEAETGDGRLHTVTMPASQTRQQWLTMVAISERHDRQTVDADFDAYYWSRVLAKDHAMYIRYAFCRDARPTFADLAMRALTAIDSGGLTRVIVDLRGNPGGNSEIIRPLITGLAARSQFRHPGALIVLVDRGTYSSAILNATEMRLSLGAVVIGEAPGGAPWHFGEVKTMQLPNSELRVVYPTRFHGYGPRDLKLIQPDVPVTMSLNDFLAGRDPVLEAALRYGWSSAR